MTGREGGAGFQTQADLTAKPLLVSRISLSASQPPCLGHTGEWGGRPGESNNPGAEKVLGGWGPRRGSNFAWGLRAGRKLGKLSQLRLYDGWKVARRTRGSQRRKRLPGRGNSICKGSVAWSSLSEGSGLHPLGIGEAKRFKQGGR